jgi:hypothetical protein
MEPSKRNLNTIAEINRFSLVCTRSLSSVIQCEPVAQWETGFGLVGLRDGAEAVVVGDAGAGSHFEQLNVHGA